MTTLTVDDGTVVELGAVLAKAGEGSIYEVAGRTDVVAKLFHETLIDRAEKLDKVAAMAKTQPPGAIQDDGFVVLTWPKNRVMRMGRPTGYLMARIDSASAVEIHTLSNPFNRANPLKGAPRWTVNATWAHLIDVAANLCLAVDAVHRVNAVVGDFQERNILVSNTTRVTLVDCDSMQFTDPDGRQFLCGVARPEFAAPELAQVNLRSHPRLPSSDLFALAVHIYQLLMGGNHPFMRGSWTGAGNQPHALDLAKSGCWAGGPGSPLTPHPLAPPVSFLPADLVRLFGRAFTDGARDPELRPSATEWRRALRDVGTTTCRRGTHHIPVDTSVCPWCAVDSERVRRRQHATSKRTEKTESQHVSHIPDPDPPGRTTAAPRSGAPPRQTRGTGMPYGPRRTPRVSKRIRHLAVSHSANAAIAALLIGHAGAFYASGGAHQPRHGEHGTPLALSESRDADPFVRSVSPTATPLPMSTKIEDPVAAQGATTKAIKKAGVGDCIHRETVASKDEGSGGVTVRPSLCWTHDATDEVVMRTDDPVKCTTHDWVSSNDAVAPIVLCLDKP